MSTENTIYDNNQSFQFNNNENTVYDENTSGNATTESNAAPALDLSTPTKAKGSMWKKVVIGGAAGLVFGGGATAAVTMASSSKHSTDAKTNVPKAEENSESSTDDSKPETDNNEGNTGTADNKEGSLFGFGETTADQTAAANTNTTPAQPHAEDAPAAQDVNITVNHHAAPAETVAPAAPAAQNLTIEVVDYGNLEVATSVNDDMSFAQAFAAARAECGTGGVFEWHGNLYNTYTVEEWNAMNETQHDMFAQNMTVEGHLPVDQMPADDLIAQDTTITIHTEDEVVAVEAPDPQVEVLGVEYNPELEANVADVLVDENEVFLIDVDGDNQFDVLIADANSDGEIQPDEIIDITEHQINVEDLGGFTGPTATDYGMGEDIAATDTTTYEI